jgi:AcrR family transcriptional regulator
MNLPQGDPSPASARAEAQRERILSAAQKCFIESGFHAASMANIAETAGMSAGLMYRYFENKNAIVLAIIDRQLRDAHESLSRENPASDLAADLFALFRGWQARDPSVMNAALYLEMSAEGTRDPQVAAAVRAADAQLHEDLKAWIARPRDLGGLGLPAERAAARAVMLQSFARGLAVNAVRTPGLDAALVRRAIEDFVRALLAT